MYKIARRCERPGRALGAGSNSFLRSAEDMAWLREVHLPHLDTRYHSAVLFGNEDAPDQIECYVSADPKISDRPQIWIPAREVTQREVLEKYPRLVAHLMCASLGYFCPLSAANAIAAYLEDRPFPCEWYSHMCSCRGRGYFDRETLLEIGRDTIESAFRNRRQHRGYMSEIQHARNLVLRELEHEGASIGMLAGWF